MTKRLRFKDIFRIHQYPSSVQWCICIMLIFRMQGAFEEARNFVERLEKSHRDQNQKHLFKLFPKSVGLFSQLFEQDFPGILCMTNGDMSGHVQWTCGSEMHTAALTIILFLVDTQGTCSKNVEQRHTTGTKSWHLHKQENVAHRRKYIPLISCSDTSPFVPWYFSTCYTSANVAILSLCPLGDLLAATCHSDKSLHRLLQLWVVKFLLAKSSLITDQLIIQCYFIWNIGYSSYV